MQDIKNIIFDLGGVLLHLEPQRTWACFQALVGDKKLYTEFMDKMTVSQFFEKFEVGAFEEATFFETLQKNNPNPITKKQLELAWNAMLLHFPADSFTLLEKLRAMGYQLYLYSNTNSIHLRDFQRILKEENGVDNFDALFDKAYYSHLIQHRKPMAAGFQYILDDNIDLVANECLFIDDNAPNLVGARRVGMQTYLHEANSDLYKGLKKYLQF